VKLKTVSALTLMVALLCLAALIAGKAAVSSSSNGPKERQADARTHLQPREAELSWPPRTMKRPEV